jgi:hypothetical protein
MSKGRVDSSEEVNELFEGELSLKGIVIIKVYTRGFKRSKPTKIHMIGNNASIIPGHIEDYEFGCERDLDESRTYEIRWANEEHSHSVKIELQNVSENGSIYKASVLV